MENDTANSAPAPKPPTKPIDVVSAFRRAYEGKVCRIDGGHGCVRVVTVGCRTSGDKPVLLVHYAQADSAANVPMLYRNFTYDQKGYSVEFTSHAEDVQPYTEEKETP